MKPGSRILITGGAVEGVDAVLHLAWSFSEDHLREMLRTAAAGDPLELLGYRPMDPTEAKASLKAAISACSRAMTGRDAKNP